MIFYELVLRLGCVCLNHVVVVQSLRLAISVCMKRAPKWVRESKYVNEVVFADYVLQVSYCYQVLWFAAWSGAL